MSRPQPTARDLLARLRLVRGMGGPRVIIRNAQIGLACVRRGVRWGSGSKFEQTLIARYQS